MAITIKGAIPSAATVKANLASFNASQNNAGATTAKNNVGGAVTSNGIVSSDPNSRYYSASAVNQNNSGDSTAPSRYAAPVGSLTPEEQASIQFTPAKSYNDIYASRMAAAQGTIDAIEKKYTSDLSGVTEQNTQEEERTKAIASMAGLQGSPSAASELTTTENAGSKRTQALSAQRALDISKTLQAVDEASRTEASSEQARALKDSSTVVANRNALKDSTITKMASVGVDPASWKSNDPSTYSYMLNTLYNGDENAMMADYVAKSKGTVDPTPVAIVPDGKGGSTSVFSQKKPDGTFAYISVKSPVDLSDPSKRYSQAVIDGPNGKELAVFDRATNTFKYSGGSSGGSGDSTTSAADAAAATAPLGTGQSGDILSTAGVSIAAFNYLTQGTSSMSRMTAGQRTKIMNEAQAWLKAKGIDISTFQSQYKAYNDVLQKNISRFNNTKIMEGEVAGSADALLSVISDQDLKNLKVENIAKLFAGEQVNDPLVQKYSFQLESMKNDLAGYFAAARGANLPDASDSANAEKVIKNGVNGRSVTAFKEALDLNATKMQKVLANSVNSVRKDVWGLFGVGDKFKADTLSTIQPDGTNNSAPAAGAANVGAGDLVEVDGVQYTIDTDGQTLIPVNQ